MSIFDGTLAPGSRSPVLREDPNSPYFVEIGFGDKVERLGTRTVLMSLTKGELRSDRIRLTLKRANRAKWVKLCMSLVHLVIGNVGLLIEQKGYPSLRP